MKRWTQFLLCLLLSASVWLIHNMSREYTGVVSVPVLATSSLKGRAATATESVAVDARCSATGFRLLRLKHASRDVHITIHPEDFVYNPFEDRYTVSAAELAKYSADIFGEGVKLETFLNSGYSFLFRKENYRTVPVSAVWNGTFKPQYMASGPIRFQPDSVTIYGDDSLLETVDAVLTRPLNYNDLSKSAGGVARLVPIPGIRMSEQEVTWSLEVVRYVETRTEVSVITRNVPFGISFSVFPSTVEAVFRCRFPVKGDPSDVCEFYVDYSEFASSLSGSCIVHCDYLPNYVIDYSIIPEVVECMELEGQE